jgi:hypothetical protein
MFAEEDPLANGVVMPTFPRREPLRPEEGERISLRKLAFRNPAISRRDIGMQSKYRQAGSQK